MLKGVLAVARPIFQLSEEFDKLRVYILDPELQDDGFAFLLDILFQLCFHLLHDFFDAGRMDSSIHNKLLNGHSG